VEDKERDDQRRDGDAVARKGEKIFVGFDDQRNVAACRLQHQRSEHDQEGHCQRGKGSDQRVADRFQSQPVPTPWLDHRISAVERDAQAFDAIRREVHREHHADGQRVAAGCRQHVMDLARQRIGDLLRPGLQHQPSGLIGKFLRSEETGE